MVLSALGAPDHPVVRVAERAGDVRRHCADVTEAGGLLGWQPHPLLEQQIQETVDFYVAEFTR